MGNEGRTTMRTAAPLARVLAERLVTVQRAQISDLCDRRIRLAFADTVAVALAGLGEPAVRTVLSLADEAPGRATIWGRVGRVAALDAAFVNGTAAHALDYDDCAPAALIHPSAVLVPAIAALAEERDASGREVVAAYAAGFETALRLGRGMVPEHLERGWHPSATIGVIGVAAAASVLLNLNVDKTTTALAIAASLAGGLGANLGSMTKPLHCGHAARNGLLAARLAERGFTAQEHALDGRNGYLQCFAGIGPERVERLLQGWMSPPELEVTEFGPKRYPCCGSTHSAVDAARRLRRQAHLDPHGISSITIEIAPPRLPNIDRPVPQTALEAKFSVQYVVARMLLDGRVTLGDFEADAWDDPKIRRLLACTRAVPRADCDDAGPVDFRCRVSVKLLDGVTLTETHDGGWFTPSDEEARQKFEDCVAHGPATISAAPAFDALMSLTDAPSVGKVLDRLRPSPETIPHGADGARSTSEVS